MKPPVIFDVDGVLADFIQSFLSLAAEMWPDRKITVYRTPEQKKWENLADLTTDEISRVWNRIKQEDRFWLGIPPLIQAHEGYAIAQLHRERDVYFVTARVGKRPKYETELWLDLVLGVRKPTVIISKWKGEIAKAVGAGFLIDDKAGNAIATTWLSPNTKAYVIDRPYNQFDTDVVGGKIHRVQTVTEFLEAIDRG